MSRDKSITARRTIRCVTRTHIFGRAPPKVTTEEDIASGRVFPGLRNLRECALKVSEACVEHALELGTARVVPGCERHLRI